MGNVMTPFFPPKAAFIPKLVNIAASGPYTNSFYIDITTAQADNDIIYVNGSATNPGSIATLAFVYINLPSTARTKVYTFNIGNITLSTSFTTAIGIVAAQSGTSIDLNVNTSMQVAFSATGYGTSGVPIVRRVSSTGITFSS